jgi:hypothetical protein
MQKFVMLVMLSMPFAAYNSQKTIVELSGYSYEGEDTSDVGEIPVFGKSKYRVQETDRSEFDEKGRASSASSSSSSSLSSTRAGTGLMRMRDRGASVQNTIYHNGERIDVNALRGWMRYFECVEPGKKKKRFHGDSVKLKEVMERVEKQEFYALIKFVKQTQNQGCFSEDFSKAFVEFEKMHKICHEEVEKNAAKKAALKEALSGSFTGGLF